MLISGSYDLIIAGLGNPESRYDNTRHNIGFRAAEATAALFDAEFSRQKFNSLIADGKASGKRVLIIKPLTYMNNSGEAVSAAMRFYKIPPEKLLVLCDDVYFDVGNIRIRKNGSDGGHNGLKSIETLIGTENFTRIRIGVGKKPAAFTDLADWVLSSFSSDENTALEETLKRVCAAIRLIVEGDVDTAMSRYNRKANAPAKEITAKRECDGDSTK